MKEIKVENGIEKISVNGSVIEVDYNEKEKEVLLSTTFSPTIIDSNFNELEKMYKTLTNRLSVLENTINKMENKINILNAIMKNE